MIVIYSFCVSLLFALIHATFTINTVQSIAGLTFFLSGILWHFKNQNIVKKQPILAPSKQIESTANEQITVITDGGNYNERIERDYIGRDYIGRDSVNKNIKNINVGDRKVKIDPNDIGETFDEFRDILMQSIAQSSNALEAISEFAKELAEELRNRPEVKVCFGVDENIAIQELVNKIFIDLLTKTYDQINEVNKISRITQPSQVQKINIYSSSGFIERFEDCGNDEYDISYREYTIHLFQEKLKRWLYRIKRSDSSIFIEYSKHSRNIYFAIGRAIDKIDNEIDDIKRKNSINDPE